MIKPTSLITSILAVALLFAVMQSDANAYCLAYRSPIATPAVAGAPSGPPTYVYRAIVTGVRGPALPLGTGHPSIPASLEYTVSYSAVTPASGSQPFSLISDMALDAGINTAQPVTATVILDQGANQSNWCTNDANPAGAISFAGLPAGSVITLINNGAITADYSAASPAILLGPGITLKLDNTNGIVQNNAGAAGVAIQLNGGSVTWLGGNNTSQVIGTVQ